MNLDPMNIIYRSKGALTPESMRQADRLRYEDATRKWNAEHGTTEAEQTGEAEITADEKQALIDQLKAEKARLEKKLKEMEAAEAEADICTESNFVNKSGRRLTKAEVKQYDDIHNQLMTIRLQMHTKGCHPDFINAYWVREHLKREYEAGLINLAEYKHELSNLHKKQ